MATTTEELEPHTRRTRGNVALSLEMCLLRLFLVIILSYMCSSERLSHDVLCFSAKPRFRDLIEKLVQTTDLLILAHSRKIATSSEAQRTQPRMSLVPLAWSVSQRASRDINILTAIE